jgi:hypothetical protein
MSKIPFATQAQHSPENCFHRRRNCCLLLNRTKKKRKRNKSLKNWFTKFLNFINTYISIRLR